VEAAACFPTMPIEIRKMRPEDLEAAMGILRVWNMAPTAPSPDHPDPERTELAVDRTFVALDGDRVVGVESYLMRSAEVAETASLAVDPSYRGRNVGYRLQEARLGEMVARGVRQVHTEADRPETVAWYVGKFGYRVVGTNPKKHAFSLPDVDHWTVLHLDLTSWMPRS